MAKSGPSGPSRSGGPSRSTHQAVEIVGLRQFRRDLKQIDADLVKEINKYFRVKARELQAEAKTRTPLKSGALRKSVKQSVTNKEMKLFSDLPYAAAHEWGTTGKPGSKVQPRGVPIKIHKSQMLGHTVFRHREDIEEYAGNLIDHLAQVNGFDD